MHSPESWGNIGYSSRSYSKKTDWVFPSILLDSLMLAHLLNPDRNTRLYRLYIHVINVGFRESLQKSHNPKSRLESLRNVILPPWIFFAQNRKYPKQIWNQKLYVVTQYTFCFRGFSTEAGGHYNKIYNGKNEHFDCAVELTLEIPREGSIWPPLVFSNFVQKLL